MEELITVGIAQSIILMAVLFFVGWGIGKIFTDEKNNDTDERDWPESPWL